MQRDLNLEARVAELRRRRQLPSRGSAASEEEHGLPLRTARHSPTLRAEGVFGEQGLPHHKRHLVLAEGRMAPLAGRDALQALEEEEEEGAGGGALAGVLRRREAAGGRNRGLWAPPEPALDNRLLGRGLLRAERSDPEHKKLYAYDIGGGARGGAGGGAQRLAAALSHRHLLAQRWRGGGGRAGRSRARAAAQAVQRAGARGGAAQQPAAPRAAHPRPGPV